MSTTDTTNTTSTPTDRTDRTLTTAPDETAPTIAALTCPADGTLLEAADRPEPGRFECPHCRHVWPAWEVVR